MNKNFIVNHSFSQGFNETMSELLEKYGDTIFEIQGISNNSMDIVKFSKKFFKSASSSVADTTVDGNANVSERNTVNYNSENNKSLMRLNSLYLLYKYIEEIYGTSQAKSDIERIINGEIFVNDLHIVSIPYCFSFDICDLLVNGMDFFNGNMEIHAPKNPDSFIALTIQTTAYISNQIAGAIAYPSFFVALDYMYRREFTDDYILHRNMVAFKKRIENQFQNLIYSLNFPFRSGVQSAFTNLSVLDSGFMESLFSGYVYPDGSEINQESVIELSKWFFEYYTKINCSEGMFTFPVMTLAISLDENGKYIDPDFVDWCAKANSEKSLANIFIDIPTAYSSCCRLRSDLKKINALGYQNSFGVGGVKVGSLRVAGINLPRLASGDSKLDDVLNSIHRVLFAQRTIIKERIDAGFMSLYDTGWMSLSKQYSTIGFVGAYEYMELLKKQDQFSNPMTKLSDVLQYIESNIQLWQETDKCMYNIEQIPAESMAVRLAEIDRELGFNDTYKLYSNQYISLMEDDAIFDRFVIQGHFDKLTTGGAILHLNIDDNEPISPKQFRRLIDVAKFTGTKYFGVNYAFSMCEKKHYTTGNNELCPVCKSNITDKYTRVVGFLTSVKNWVSVRREFEFPNRVFYNNSELLNT